MQSIPPPAEDRVVCSNHPLLGAVFTCQRCGSFGCEGCRSPSLPTLCQGCAQRVLPSGSLTAGALLQDSFSLLSRNLSGVGIVLVISLLGELPLRFLPVPVAQHWLLPFLISTSVTAFSTAVFFSWTAGGLLQQPGRSLLSSLRVGLLRCSTLFLMNLLYMGAIFGGALLLILPGIYFAVCLSLAPALVVLDGLGPLQSLQRSSLLTVGHRWSLLVVFGSIFLLQVLLTQLIPFSRLLLPAPVAALWVEWGQLFTLTFANAFCAALLDGAIVLAWMRLTGRVLVST
ncbi:hypothetical protein [Archangium lansingense]|uniref:B box-type domain-containing protein n=1 Tax=Archangium lansingense TaxID=2995310 RepID=A0ABT4APD6_9BACT|nr:hypothetical protein [Archangium lansinium]MCY1083565.1 hypothetical protein [Archangium lansinium]